MSQAALYACLYVKEFPAQALLRLRPDLHRKPCVVMQGEPPMQQVCSLNTKARLLGMSRGMTRVEVETFAEPIVLPRSHAAETATKAVLLECAGAFSPRVEDCSEANALLFGIDIAGTRTLFGPAEMLARHLLRRARALGISATVTVSRNFHAAVCLAKGLTARTPSQVIAEGHEAEALSGLRLFVLDLSEKQAETFELWGIRTLGMLAALPEDELIARLGQESQRLLQLARGELPHLLQPVEPVFSLEERMELDAPLEVLDSLLFGVAVMLDQLILRARARILALASVTIVLSLDGGGTHTRTVRPALPAADKQLWLKLIHLELEAHPPSAAILAVALQAEPGTISKVQLGLFSPQMPQAERLDVTLARIRALVGEECVGRAVLEDTYAPEAFRMQPFIVPSTDATASYARSRSALRQLRPPQAVAVTLQHGRPAHFFFREKKYAVDHAYGPWAASGEWWTPGLWAFEQWDVIAHAPDGAMLCCCMTRDVLQRRWELAAFYD
jgi:protein ImuB